MSTFILIHGSYQGGWIWQRAVARLRGAGHTVYSPTLDGCAERTHQVRTGIATEHHASEIAELLFYEDLRDVVIVGTSSGGMVLCRAAEAAHEGSQDWSLSMRWRSLTESGSTRSQS
jgi:pimeloyl-ACP methyl ester carboxylesterase